MRNVVIGESLFYHTSWSVWMQFLCDLILKPFMFEALLFKGMENNKANRAKKKIYICLLLDKMANGKFIKAEKTLKHLKNRDK